MPGKGTTNYLLLSMGIAAIGSMQFGLHLAELNAPQDVITCRKKFVSTIAGVVAVVKSAAAPDGHYLDCIPMDEAAFASISSIFTVGGLIGALASGPLSSRRGRLSAMRMTSVLFILGSVLETIAHSPFLLALGRFVSGVGAGATTVIVPLYISELCPPDSRGFFGFMTQVSINFGILLTQTLGYFLSHGSAWRWILGAGACFAIAHGVGLAIVPETPAWLAAHGRVVQAQDTLQMIRGRDADVREEMRSLGLDRVSTAAAASGADEEERGLLSRRGDEDEDDDDDEHHHHHHHIRNSSDNDDDNDDGSATPPNAIPAKTDPVHLGFLQVVRDPATRPVIVALVGIMFVQQFCGINSVIMYSVSLLSDLLPISSALLSIIVSAANLMTTMACAPLPDRLGRKTCLIISILGQGSSSLVLALSIVFGLKALSALAVLAFVCFFGVGLGPVPFILASELVGQEAIGATQSWCLGANYIATFLVAQFFPIVNKALNAWLGGAGWVYFLFAAAAAVSAVFVSWSFRSLRFQAAAGY
ncbi:putative metabolite transport protein [Escovopsis weberi]|uniref:Putative metabolite transport protein n=1 Tax=Escovopsis weberi TaxID=150374 RepID=A0A0M8N827_ESCWE|nr:putative metabolite transport protein [Escovopsis weberi]